MQWRQLSQEDEPTGLSLPVKRTSPFQIMRAVVTIRPAEGMDSISVMHVHRPGPPSWLFHNTIAHQHLGLQYEYGFRHCTDALPRFTPCVKSCLVSMSPAPRLFATPFTAPLTDSMAAASLIHSWYSSDNGSMPGLRPAQCRKGDDQWAASGHWDLRSQ